MPSVTIKEAVIRYVSFNPGRSATTIATALGKKVGSVSSVLHDLLKAGTVVIAGEKGPRGGLCYRLRADPGPPSNKTAWAHLQDEDGL